MESLLLLIWNYVIPFLLVLTVLVFIHELGHYAVARWCKVRVEVFSVGFGRELFGWTDGHGTRWKFSAIPFGGYVKMFGEQLVADGEKPPAMSPEDEAVAFHNKTLRQRAAIVFAGPAANFILAVAIIAGAFMTIGQQYTPANIDSIVPDSAAEAAGLQPGDTVVEINGTKIERFEQIVQIVQITPGLKLDIVVDRGGELVPLTAVSRAVEITDRFGNTHKVGRLGISRTSNDRRYVKHDPATAVWRAGQETVIMTGNIFEVLWQIISGTREAKDLGGPLRIAQVSGDMWQTGIVSLIMFAALLSINLGLINLFPIPMLDGGHLLFYACEAIRGRPLGERAQEYGFRIGIAMVFALMIFATWNDLVQMRVVDYIVNMIT